LKVVAESSTTSPLDAERDTFPKLVRENARRLADKVAIREKDLGIWQSSTWSQYFEQARLIALGLASLGFARGDRVAIVGDNRPQLYWAVTAAQALGGVPVPIYQDSIEREMEYIVEHSEARFAIVEDQEQVDKLLGVRARCRHLQHVVYDDPRGLRGYSEPGLMSLAELTEQGKKFEVGHPGHFDAELARGAADDIAIICYTSGRATRRPSRGSARTKRWSPICRWRGWVTTSSPTRRRSSPASRSTARRARRRCSPI
jgi:long-chain acyl-CoA synthetase